MFDVAYCEKLIQTVIRKVLYDHPWLSCFEKKKRKFYGMTSPQWTYLSLYFSEQVHII